VSGVKLTEAQCATLCRGAEARTIEALGLVNDDAMGARSTVTAQFTSVATKMRVTIELEMPEAMWLSALAEVGR
jgi:hypothetical protein